MHNDNSLSHSDLQNTLQLPFLVSRSNGVIRMSGADRIDLLHRLSTNTVVGKSAGDVVETILTTDKGRVIDVLLVVYLPSDLLLISSPGKTADVLTWLERYTIMEDVTYTDVSDQFTVYWRFEDRETPLWKWEQDGDGFTVHHQSIRGQGTLFLVKRTQDGTEEAFLKREDIQQLRIASERDYHLWRVAHIYPDAGYELTELVNPLESGASALVNFTKGCYIGQEVIARLDSYDKVQRKIVRIVGNIPESMDVPPGTPLLSGTKNAGFITSLFFDPQRNTAFGLACVRHAFAQTDNDLECHLGDDTFSVTIV